MRLVIDPSEDDLLHVCLLRLYFVCLATVWLYSFSRWKNLAVAVYQHYMTTGGHQSKECYYDEGKDEREGFEISLIEKWEDGDVTESTDTQESFSTSSSLTEDSDQDDDRSNSLAKEKYPAVTVQICSYNEAAVIKETINRACSLDWPRKSLFVQVLDDSTEEHSKMVVQQCVERLRFRGCNVEVKRRPNREGYKAGNLAYHFSDIKTQYVLYLDGDHRVEPDLLRRSILHFYDRTTGHQRTDVALVQTPWGYYNTHANILTECDAIGLDIHHTIEQTSRAHLYQMFGFNGTGGIWSTKAVADAGGWTSDTVTEDLSISYLAFLKGYKFVYVKDCPQELELPQGIMAHIQQKQRWTKGFLQVFRLYYWKILVSDHTSGWLKLEAFMHLTGPIQLVAAVVGILVYPYLVFHDIHTRMLEALSIFPVIEPICSAIHAVLTKTGSKRSSYVADHIRFARFLWVLPFFALRFGMAPFEMKAILEGLLSNDATFHTTPKEGDSRKATNTSASVSSKLKRHWVDDVVATLSIFISLHQFGYIMIYDRHFERYSVFNWCVGILNVLICFGMAGVSMSFLMAKGRYFRWNVSPSVSCLSRRICYIGMIALCFLNNSMMCIMHVIPAARISDVPATATATVVSKEIVQVNSKPDFLCMPEDVNKDVQLHAMSPIVVFAEPRTGSNLLFDMFGTRRDIAQSYQLLNLYELFQFGKREEWRPKSKIFKSVATSCGIPNPIEDATNTTETETIIKSSQSPIAQYVEEKFQQRHAEPGGLLGLLSSIPVKSRRAFYMFKIFNGHIKKSAFETPGAVVDVVRGRDKNAHFLVLWRRRIIESFVSYKIASARDAWTDKAVDVKTDKIRIDKVELEEFIELTRDYYLGVKQSLLDRNQDFEVIEYDRDLSSLDGQESTVAKIESMLGLDDEPSRAEETISNLSRKKQSTVDIKELVTNWDDVVRWGYGGEAEEWEDIFA